MKLGLICDIHEHVEHLQLAIDHFAACAIDRIIVIGDLFATGERIEELCRLLAAADAIGVWGNHDYGLCFEPSPEVRSRFSSDVLNYMGTYKPRMEIDGCYFAHVEPWLNPEDILDLWYYDGPPDRPERLARIFGAVPHAVIFNGHFHRWILATPDGVTGWEGQTPLHLTDTRAFVVMGALHDGHCATFDTRTRERVPWSLASNAAVT